MRNEGCCIVKHDLCHTRLYGLWKAMKRRVAVNKYYKNVSICKEWEHDPKAFYDWAIANGYQDDLTLDRIDVKGNYEPNNCRWVTMKVQCNNRKNGRYLTAFGKTQTIAQWSDETGISWNNIIRRIEKFGWSVEKALITPTRKIERR